MKERNVRGDVGREILGVGNRRRGKKAQILLNESIFFHGQYNQRPPNKICRQFLDTPSRPMFQFFKIIRTRRKGLTLPTFEEFGQKDCESGRNGHQSGVGENQENEDDILEKTKRSREKVSQIKDKRRTRLDGGLGIETGGGGGIGGGTSG